MAAQLKHYLEQSTLYIFPDNCFEEILLKLEILHRKCTKIFNIHIKTILKRIFWYNMIR